MRTTKMANSAALPFITNKQYLVYTQYLWINKVFLNLFDH